MAIRISQSVELPITTGTIEVDTSMGGVTIFMKSGPSHGKHEFLKIVKVSNDSNLVSLYGETSLINGNDIIIFGVPIYAKVKKGKIKTMILKSDGTNWRIVNEG